MKLGKFQLDGKKLFLIAGPCVLENEDTPKRIAARMKEACAEHGLPYIFKASFDKANRTSGKSFRGPGIDAGLKQLESIKEEFDVPVLTDVHLPEHCAPAAEVCDILQIPAFLCRQTDLLEAAAEVEDLVQDVFLDAHLGFLSIRDPAALRSWVYTIAVRHVRKRLRRHRLRRFVGLDEVSDYATLTCRDASPEQRVVLAAVFRTLDTLPADVRIAWHLHCVERETLPRVAELCGCSRATAHRRIAVAQAHIAEVMDHE